MKKIRQRERLVGTAVMRLGGGELAGVMFLFSSMHGATLERGSKSPAR